MPRTPKPRRAGGGRTYLLALACGGAAVASPGSALALAAWLLPALLLWIAERGRGHPVARCLLLAGGAGALPALAGLWSDGATLADAAARATEPRILALPWGAQASAWLLAQIVPLLTAAAVEAAAAARAARLRAARARLALEFSLGEDAS